MNAELISIDTLEYRSQLTIRFKNELFEVTIREGCVSSYYMPDRLLHLCRLNDGVDGAGNLRLDLTTFKNFQYVADLRGQWITKKKQVLEKIELEKKFVRWSNYLKPYFPEFIITFTDEDTAVFKDTKSVASMRIYRQVQPDSKKRWVCNPEHVRYRSKYSNGTRNDKCTSELLSKSRMVAFITKKMHEERAKQKNQSLAEQLNEFLTRNRNDFKQFGFSDSGGRLYKTVTEGETTTDTILQLEWDPEQRQPRVTNYNITARTTKAVDKTKSLLSEVMPEFEATCVADLF